MAQSMKEMIHEMTRIAAYCCLRKIKHSYSTNEDDAVEDGHGNSNHQRFTFGDTNVELWFLTWADITAEER